MRVLCLSFLLSLPAQAEVLTSDVFGIYEGHDQTRAEWAGERRVCEDGNCRSEIIGADEIFKIESIFGEKSLRAGRDTGMSLGIFTDEYGNLVPKGIASAHAIGSEKTLPMDIENGIGTAIFRAGLKAGNEYSNIFTQNIQSERRFYRNVPEIESIALEISEEELVGQQGDVMPIKTNILQDRYGNTAPIGMATSLILQNESGEYGYLPLITQTDSASEVFHTTTMKGEYEYILSSAYQQSEPGTLTVVPQELIGIENIRADFEISTDVLIVTFSGIKTNLNHEIQDAARIVVEVTEANGHRKSYPLYSLKGDLSGRFPIYENAFPINFKLISEYGVLRARLDENEVRRIR